VCEQCPTPLVTGHRFQPHPLQPEVCGWDGDGWPCGYAEEEHAAVRLEGARGGGGEAIEKP
jgi:hypothetical protein